MSNRAKRTILAGGGGLLIALAFIVTGLNMEPAGFVLMMVSAFIWGWVVPPLIIPYTAEDFR